MQYEILNSKVIMPKSLPEYKVFNSIISSTGSTYEDEQYVLELLSTIMNNNAIRLPNEKPIHLCFFRNLPVAYTTDEFLQKLKELPVNIIFCDSWEKFTRNLKLCPNSATFGVDGLSKDSIEEIVSMINTLSKLVGGNNNISITARIDKNTTYDTIKLLQKSNIAGIIPACADFGEQETMKAWQAQWTNIPYWPKHIIDQLPGAIKPTASNSTDIKLTPRQEQIFSIIVTKGVSNKAIAKMLHITESTVKLHMGHILKKFGVKNRTQLVAFSKS